jgi:hypothetical protein
MPAPKKPAKVIDGVHAGAAPAAPTSRPLITNRPFMAMDPMLNPTQGAGDTTEQPSSEPPKKPVAAHSVDRTAKDIMPSAELVEAAEKEDDIVETDETTPATKEAVPVEAADTPPTNEADEHKPALVPSSPEKPLKTIPSKAPDEDEAETDADLKADVPNTEEDAAAAQKLEIERHIAAGTYFVTINHRRHHRRTVLLVVVLMLIAAGVALDILLDMGVLKLPSLPHTNFF